MASKKNGNGSKRDFVRVVVVSDFHCGHVVGLTHPDFNPQYAPDTKHYQIAKLRGLYWSLYADALKSLQPIDVLVVNGDCIDGKGEATGGTEQLTNNRIEQVDMAVAAIQEAHAPTVVMTYGTGYHTGKGEDWEDQVAAKVGARIGSHEWLDVRGCVFDCKHHVSGSQVPHGRHTAAARERLWNVLWSEHGEFPKANIIIRSHVHYWDYCGGHEWLALTTPALQGYGSKFGKRRMSGTVDFGFLSFDVQDAKQWELTPHIWKYHEFGSVALHVD